MTATDSTLHRLDNLFADAEAPEQGERFETWLGHRGLQVERIISSAGSDGALYDQAWDEWVVLLRGEAEVEVEGRRRSLAAGDVLWLPAHTRHQVCSTSAGALWLAVHDKRSA